MNIFWILKRSLPNVFQIVIRVANERFNSDAVIEDVVQILMADYSKRCTEKTVVFIIWLLQARHFATASAMSTYSTITATITTYHYYYY